VEANDPENDNLIFVITLGNTGDAFQMNARSGDLFTTKALDFETNSTYTLKISASDGKLSSTADITINDESSLMTLEGKAQKGPFLNGTSVTISELDEDYTLTGRDFNTLIIDNSGAFEIPGIELSGDYVTFTVNGFYFNEVCGEFSNSPIILSGIGDVGETILKNLNVITHLEKARVEYLLAQGSSFSEAKKQAQQEVLNIFHIDDNIGASETLDLTEDAVLIALSAILQGYRSEGQFSQLMANIITDIREDGTLDNRSVGEDLYSHAKVLNTKSILMNIENYYDDIGQSLTLSEEGFKPIIDNFLQETEFQKDTSIINYSRFGRNGSANLLFDALGDGFQSTFISLSANLPNPCMKLKIVMRADEDNACYQVPNPVNVIQNHCFSKLERVLPDRKGVDFSIERNVLIMEADGTTTDMYVDLSTLIEDSGGFLQRPAIESGKYIIEYYEGNTTDDGEINDEPVRTRTIVLGIDDPDCTNCELDE